MKKKLVLFVCIMFLCSIFTTAGAENINKCKTMVDGMCTEYYPSEINENSEGLISQQPKQNMMYANQPKQVKKCSKKFGFWYALDPYANVWSTWEVYNQTKIFITYVEPGTPAASAGLSIGDEITKINGIRAVKFKSADFANYVDGQYSIRIETKNKKNVTLSRMEFCTVEQEEPLFDAYWKQVCSYNIEFMNENLNHMKRVLAMLTQQARYDYKSQQNELFDWMNKREQFRNGFNMCLQNTYSVGEANACLNQLVNRSIGVITHEQNIQAQREYLYAQQQMHNEEVNALNNYSHALRNQHVQVDANVNHNVDVSGTIYHRLRY